MRQLVLAVGGAVAQAAEHFQHFGVQTGHVGIESGLFGGFPPAAHAAYAEAAPLAPGHEERVGLWQLYPVLVHVCLFGGGYAAQARELLGRYA